MSGRGCLRSPRSENSAKRAAEYPLDGDRLPGTVRLVTQGRPDRQLSSGPRTPSGRVAGHHAELFTERNVTTGQPLCCLSPRLRRPRIKTQRHHPSPVGAALHAREGRRAPASGSSPPTQTQDRTSRETGLDSKGSSEKVRRPHAGRQVRSPEGLHHGGRPGHVSLQRSTTDPRRATGRTPLRRALVVPVRCSATPGPRLRRGVRSTTSPRVSSRGFEPRFHVATYHTGASPWIRGRRYQAPVKGPRSRRST
jgi:hypothetical protein